jgi:4-amino-4-deoxy-L-arabinose transferase-like glycosyltransferase
MSVVTLPALGRRAPPWYEWVRALPVRIFWGCFAVVMGLSTWNAFWRLSDTFVRDYDEGRYGVAASEMLHRHSVLVTTYAGATEFWNLKPPLGYWLLELSYRLVGETPFGLRLPAAACAVATTALTMLFARTAAGPRAAILAGLILTTSFGFMAHHGARSGDLDAPLTLLLFLLMMLAPRISDSRQARLAMGLVLSLGFLLKSFAILPYVAALGTYCLLTRGVSSWRAWMLPLSVTIVVTTTWAVARSVAEDSSEFVRRMFVEDLLLRSTTAIDPDPASVWDYPGALFDRLVPWPLIVMIAWGLSRRFAKQRLAGHFDLLLWCYCLIPLLLFTVARTHHSHYIIPLYPAWAILGAVATMEVLEAARGAHWITPVAWILGICLLACEVRLITHMEIHDRMPPAQIFLESLRDRIGPGKPLHTTFTPSYSERFFLQVVDGFTLEDGPAEKENHSHSSAMVLVRKSDPQQWASVSFPETTILAQHEDYVLVRAPGW